ncbi:MAG: hypothetical protein LBQ68_10585, partial [Clostridiales bacterium]|nr:hypothetical protein [Clostridiales bacterium]
AIKAGLALIVSNGFPDDRLRFVLHNYEYAIACIKNEPHKGIEAGIETMGEFVYGSTLDSKVYADAIEQTNQEFLKFAVNEYLLKNTHSSVVILTPKRNTAPDAISVINETNEEKLNLMEEGLLEEGLLKEDLLEESSLTNYLAKKESDYKPRSMNTSIASTLPVFKSEKIHGVKTVFTDLNTHGISSIHLYLDASAIPQNLIGYAQILAHVTADESGFLPDTLIGNSYGYLAADRKFGTQEFIPRTHLIFKGLDRDINSMTMAIERALDPDVSVSKNIVYSYLVRAKLAMDNDYENIMPTSYCLAKITSGLNEKEVGSGQYEYEINGPAYYSFIVGLLSDFENVWPTIENNLMTVKKQLPNKNNALISFTGSQDAYKTYVDNGKKLAKLFHNKVVKPRKYNFTDPEINFFPTPLEKTNSVMQGGSLIKSDAEYSGAFLVTANLLNYDYLWPLIRDKGGAYGVNVSVSHDGSVLLSSYRDPNKDETLNVYKGVPEFLRQPVNDDDYANVRAHVLSNWDEQFQPHRLWDYGAKITLGLLNESELKRIRFEIQMSLPGDMKADADIWEKILDQNIISVGGLVS